MLQDWVSDPGPLTYESGALPIVLPPASLENIATQPFLPCFWSWLINFISTDNNMVFFMYNK